MSFSLFGKKFLAPKELPTRLSKATPVAADGDLDPFTEGGGLWLEIGAKGIAPCVEQAAVLFAADHRAEARAVLEGALRQGGAPEDAWAMLLELYELTGEKRRYQSLAPKYTARFKKPPPTRAAVFNDAAKGGLQLTGQILCAAGDHFSFLLDSPGEALEVDAGGLQRVDFVSAGILLNTMLALQEAGKRVRIYQLSHLVAALFASVGIGRLAVLETKNKERL